jgi:hypothetical protein
MIDKNFLICLRLIHSGSDSFYLGVKQDKSTRLQAHTSTKQGPHSGGGKRDSLQAKKKLEATSKSKRAAGWFGPEAPA